MLAIAFSKLVFASYNIQTLAFQGSYKIEDHTVDETSLDPEEGRSSIAVIIW
jgi:hypothetical protein